MKNNESKTTKSKTTKSDSKIYRMDEKRINEVLTERNKEKVIGYSNNVALNVALLPLLMDPTEEQETQLRNGDGKPLDKDEIRQINSSAGLAFNYYKLFESEIQKIHSGFTVTFEDKVAIPLHTSGKSANLDVSYNLDCTQYYIESKFLEPYRDGCKFNRDSYYTPDKYGFDEKETGLWLELLENEKEFQYYDFPQLYRHLLAIRRKHKKEGNVALQSVSWKMTESFKKEYEMSEEDVKLIETLEKEREKACRLFNEFLEKIGWTTCSFEAKYYNDTDMLDAIKGSDKYDDFCKQYFLD